MNTPKDGFYIATVLHDTGGVYREYVRVECGKVYTKCGYELLSTACGDFSQISVATYALIWPGFAALEIESLRTANARLQDESADYLTQCATLKAVNCNLEEAVKGLFNVIDCPCPHGDSVYYCRSCVDALEFARKAKATPHARPHRI